MIQTRTVTIWITIGWLVLVGALPSGAEVSGDVVDQRFNLIVLGVIGETPEPFWMSIRQLDAQFVLNPGGHERGDGRPDVAFDPITGWPVVTWAYKTQAGYDIVSSQWNGVTWTAARVVSASGADERDPRIFFQPNGTAWIAWWQDGPNDSVWVSKRTPLQSNWGPAIPVTGNGVDGRRPSPAVRDGQLYVAYETSSAAADMEQDIAVAQGNADVAVTGGNMVTHIVASTDRVGPTDPVLHVENGILWLDWKQSNTQVCYSVALPGGSWSVPDITTISEPTWVGVEATRRQIRGAVLAAP